MQPNLKKLESLSQLRPSSIEPKSKENRITLLATHTNDFPVSVKRAQVVMAASFRWLLQLHKDVPRAAHFYSEGLGFTINVCTLRWAELQSGPLNLALMQSPNPDDSITQKGYSSHLSFTVTDINTTVTKLKALGAELDGPIKYEIHGKVAAMRCIDGHALGLYEPA
ncbi:uncharacterized protein LOC130715742 [Lotus japonicus]|uniref:uncharacterized protein LOC130715742 n=1 Tax=Lotus japonicus TaxID=34305 RepID=UPI002585A458|nr:uncharacterized protein LOC130715742 [Lotus japonicus]